MSSTPPPESAANRPEPRSASLGQVTGAVFWSFFGVRKGKAMENDAVNIKPQQVIVVGVIGAVVLVAVLMGIVLMLTH